jgi:hypothetical protein
MSYTQVADQAFTWPPLAWSDGTYSETINPAKLAYRGVLIERPCANCDTVDVHFQGKCNSGPCQVCGETERERGTWHAYVHNHEFVHGTYYPADIEFPCTCDAAIKWHHIHKPGCGSIERAFHTILAKVLEIGMPEHYSSDLFRDYQYISGLGVRRGQPVIKRFIWAVRVTGSDLYLPEVGLNTVWGERENERYFAYDGVTHGPLGDFPEVNLATARTLLSVWRIGDVAMPGNHPFVEGCCEQPEGEH